MGLFGKSSDEKKRVKEEKRIEAEQEQQRALNVRKQQQEEYKKILLRVILTPETKEQYESRVGYAVEVIETGERNKGVMVWARDDYLPEGRLWKRLAESGIEAIVQAVSSRYIETFVGRHTVQDYERFCYYGLPVAKKNGGPYR